MVVFRAKPLLAASALLLGGAALAPAQIGIPVEGITDLVRALIQRRGDTSRSARMALRDAESGLDAWLELGAGPRDEIVALFSFERDGRGLYVHTVRLRDAAGRVVRPRVIDLRPLGTEGRGEMVAAQLPSGELDWLAEATSIEITLEGWDQAFRATLDDKSLRKVRTFRDRRAQPRSGYASSSQPQEGAPP
jgi:hypothetical protein